MEIGLKDISFHGNKISSSRVKVNMSSPDDVTSVKRFCGMVQYLYDGPCLNLLRGDRVLIPVPSDC